VPVTEAVHTEYRGLYDRDQQVDFRGPGDRDLHPGSPWRPGRYPEAVTEGEDLVARAMDHRSVGCLMNPFILQNRVDQMAETLQNAHQKLEEGFQRGSDLDPGKEAYIQNQNTKHH
jgi:hypothetical protein